MKRFFSICFLGALTLVPALSLAESPDTGNVPVVEILSTVRDDLIQLRLEEALATLEVLLGRTDLRKQDRAEAWTLRSRAHVAFGDLDAAIDDYREVLSLRPGFRPESSLVTPEAEKRFNKLRAEMISTLKLDIQPADAALIIDGKMILPSATGTVAVLAGSRRIRLTKRGYDSLDEELDLPAGVEFGYQRQLFPNARDVVVRSWMPGAQVIVDGTVAGVTERSDDAAPAGSEDGVLVLRDMALGEHQFEFRFDCHLPQRLKRMVTVDIMEPTPLVLPRFELERIRIPMVARADFPGAEIFVDGRKVGDLQSEMIDLCPGERFVEWRADGRTVYSTRIEVRDGEPVEISASARPTAILIGAERWPSVLQDAATRFSLAERAVTPVDPVAADPTLWNPDDFPPDVDLVFAVLEKDGLSGGRMVLYSPVLDTFQELTPERVDALGTPRPVWLVRAPGLHLEDGSDGTGILVVAVRPDGPADRAGIVPGVKLASLGDRELVTMEEYRAALAGTDPGKPVTLRFTPGGGENGEPLELMVAAADSPFLAGPVLRGQSPEVMAAWAQVDAAAYPDRSASAKANLALVLAEAGNFEAAVETWKRVRWGDRRGVGEGTRAYYLGISLDRLGREDEAVRAFRQASGSGATAISDDGPEVAPAARDHLADLGISLSESRN